MSTIFSSEFEKPELTIQQAIQTFDAPGLPAPSHPAEADTFARHDGIPAHDQRLLSAATAMVVGAGGLGSWAGMALVKSGIGRLMLVEHDRFERTNAPRQLMLGQDLGEPKAIAVARNLVPHAPAAMQITAIAMTFQDALERFPLPCDVAVFGVDNNAARLAGARFARKRRIPAVFAMLATDSMRVHTFLQGPDDTDACIHCALPNLDPERAAPCASAVISSCMLASAFITFFTHRALMGWPENITPYNWREADLLGVVPDSTGMVTKRAGCPTCGNVRV